jgi:hypothetical protein
MQKGVYHLTDGQWEKMNLAERNYWLEMQGKRLAAALRAGLAVDEVAQRSVGLQSRGTQDSPKGNASARR